MKKNIGLIIGVVIILAFIFLTIQNKSKNSNTTVNYQNTTQTQTQGTGKTFTMADIATHNSASSCYTTINNNVYDLTSWISQHPGGEQSILALCGIDGTSAFMQQHGGQGRPEAELQNFLIGDLKK